MLFRPRKQDGVEPGERALWGDLLSLGMTFPIAIALGFFIGRWIGGLLGHPQAGMWVGLVWGVATAFWELYKTTQRMDRYDAAKARREAEQAAQDPEDQERDGDGS